MVAQLVFEKFEEKEEAIVRYYLTQGRLFRVIIGDVEMGAEEGDRCP